MRLPKHILVIRLSAMGDVAMTVPVLRIFSETYPDVKITFLTRKFLIPLFEDLPNVEVFEAEVNGRHKGVKGLKRLAGELEALGIDAVADLHNVLRSNILKVFFQLSGIPVKQINKGRKEKKQLMRKENKIFIPLKTTHQRYAEVFGNLLYPLDLSMNGFSPRKKLNPQLQKMLGEEPKKWLGIAPFAAHDSKVYPQDLMFEVIEQLQKEQKIRIFLFGGGLKETGILENWEKRFPDVLNLAGKLSFKEELAVISNLDAMLSMDSGNAHLAANFDVPVVTLWGLTHPYAGFGAYRQPRENCLLPDLKKYPAIPTSVYGKEIPEGYEEVMRTIHPERVVEKISEVIFS